MRLPGAERRRTVARMVGGRGETERHRGLKRKTLLWAQARGFALCGVEVRVPRSSFRADVAACAVGGDVLAAGETAVFECKQARADLLRDTADERASLERLREIVARRRDLECMLGLHLPDLRRGESLFAECDAYNLDAIRHDGLRAVRREEARLQAKVFGATKFARLRRYCCANRLYLVVADDVLQPHETPAGWGLLVAVGDELELLRRPERVETATTSRVALMHAIALSNVRRVNAEFAISWDEILEHRSRITPDAT
jgi:hypothetical protein